MGAFGEVAQLVRARRPVPGEPLGVVRAGGLFAAFQQMVERAHARGIRVYGATILPFGGSFYDSPEHEAARRTVNEWIRTGGAFDAVQMGFDGLRMFSKLAFRF